MAKPYKLFLSILATAVRVTNSEGVLDETVLSQQLALLFTSAGNCFAISCSMPSTSSSTLTNFSIAARVLLVLSMSVEFLGEKREDKAREYSQNYKKLLEIVEEMTIINMELLKENACR